MKTPKLKLLSTLLVLASITGLGAFTCTKQTIPEKEYVGTWTNNNNKLNVRTKTGVMNYQFTPISIPITLSINEHGLVNGNVGDVRINNINLNKNSGNSAKTGIIYSIRCGQVGKLSANDPLDKKEIELWVKPLTADKKLHVEVRQMHSLDPFPMGEVVLNKN